MTHPHIDHPRPGTVVHSRITRIARVYSAAYVRRFGQDREPIGRAADTGRMMRETARAIAPERPVLSPDGPADLTTTIRPIGCLPCAVTVRTLESDAVLGNVRADIHREAVRTIIARALDGTLTYGEIIGEHRLPDPHGGRGTRVIRRYHGSVILREHKLPLTPQDVANLTAYDQNDPEDAAILKEAVIAQKNANAAGVVAAGKALSSAAKMRISRARGNVEALAALARALTEKEMAKLERSIATLAEFGISPEDSKWSRPDRSAGKRHADLERTVGALAPTDGPMSRGENLIHPHKPSPGRFVPNPGR